jgi:dephospho-CoA kinase
LARRRNWRRPSRGDRMKKGFCVALTGGIACGKSTVAGFWRQWGAEVRDADLVAHGLIAHGGECVEAVVREFGSRVRAADGGVDRNVLGSIVFSDSSARERLNALLHPAVIRHMRAWAAESRRAGRLGVAVVPLLFEVGMEKEWDAVVCVASNEKTMLERLAQRGLSPEEARARLASQWPVSEKMTRANRVIENNGSLAELEAKCRAVWNDLFEQGE